MVWHLAVVFGFKALKEQVRNENMNNQVGMIMLDGLIMGIKLNFD